MRRGVALQVLAAMAMLGTNADPDYASSILKQDSLPKEPKPKMPLSDEELEKLASLSGKEKKKFVLELKEKYK